MSDLTVPRQQSSTASARSDGSLVSCNVLVLELSLEYECLSSEAAVRVVGEVAALIDRKLVEHEKEIVVTEFGLTRVVLSRRRPM